MDRGKFEILQLDQTFYYRSFYAGPPPGGTGSG